MRPQWGLRAELTEAPTRRKKKVLFPAPDKNAPAAAGAFFDFSSNVQSVQGVLTSSKEVEEVVQN